MGGLCKFTQLHMEIEQMMVSTKWKETGPLFDSYWWVQQFPFSRTCTTVYIAIVRQYLCRLNDCHTAMRPR